MQVLEIKNLLKKIDDITILNNISFNVNKGEILAIIGPSGSGKSTLLRCVNQLEKIDGGTIKINSDILVDTNDNGDVVYAEKNLRTQIGLKVGLVFQHFNLFPHFSVLRNITESQVKVLKRSWSEANDIAIELLEKMDLKGKKDAYPCELSGGQKQRVAIARALAMNPEILFFDEPTSALDPKLKGDFVNIIKELSDGKMTIVVVTHEMNIAKSISDRVIFMEEGKIIEDGTPKEVFEKLKNERKTFIF